MFHSEDGVAAKTGVGLELGPPVAINVDHGTKFTARAMSHWTRTR